jgi:heat shock protein HslJ
MKPFAFVLAAAALLAAEGAAAGPLPLEAEGDWTAVEIAGADVPAERPPTLTLSPDAVSGFTGCNRFHGALETDGSTVRIGPLAATRMACKGDRTALERAVLDALQSRTAGLRLDGGRLVLVDGAGDPVAVFTRAP